MWTQGRSHEFADSSRRPEMVGISGNPQPSLGLRRPVEEDGQVWSTSRTPAPTPAQPSTGFHNPALSTCPHPGWLPSGSQAQRACAVIGAPPPDPRPYFPRLTSPSSASPPQQQLCCCDWLRDVPLSANQRHAIAPVLLGRTKQKQTERARPEVLRGGGGGG